MSDDIIPIQESMFFKPYNKHGLNGYHIPVRNSFNNRIEMEFIPAEAKELYTDNFGATIIRDNEFIEWYTRNAERFQ